MMTIITCLTLVTLIQKSHKFEELLEILFLDKGIIDETKLEKLHNSQVLVTLVFYCFTSNKKLTKAIRNSFISKD